ncbi:unnamed protein product [Leptosia nina]|uniref:Uncharacterized protein n=1 Tax=Leptosia nina TaxID=320188 RepID=A0AAV1J7Q3_9NEOP
MDRSKISNGRPVQTRGYYYTARQPCCFVRQSEDIIRSMADTYGYYQSLLLKQIKGGAGFGLDRNQEFLNAQRSMLR